MSALMWDSPALPLLIELEQHGFRISLTDDDEVRIVPGSKLTADQRGRVAAHGAR